MTVAISAPATTTIIAAGMCGMPSWYRRPPSAAPMPTNANWPSDTCPANPVSTTSDRPISAIKTMVVRVTCDDGRTANGASTASAPTAARAVNQARRTSTRRATGGSAAEPTS